MSLAVFNGAAYGDQKSSVRHQQRKWPPAAGAGQSGRLPATTITYRSKLLSFFLNNTKLFERSTPYVIAHALLHQNSSPVLSDLCIRSTRHFQAISMVQTSLVFDKTCSINSSEHRCFRKSHGRLIISSHYLTH